MTTPPTEDRDWKKRFRERFPDKSTGIEARTYMEMLAFIEEEIAAARARGYNDGYNEGRADAWESNSH